MDTMLFFLVFSFLVCATKSGVIRHLLFVCDCFKLEPAHMEINGLARYVDEMQCFLFGKFKT